jgi:class 3 adenylate cyclase
VGRRARTVDSRRRPCRKPPTSVRVVGARSAHIWLSALGRAVRRDAGGALEAACRGQETLRSIDVDGYRPAMRAGVHVGRPRKLGGDYFGVDVNIAARVAAAAGGGEVLVSEAARERLDAGVALRRRWRFSAKGAPKDLRVYAAAVG